MKTVFISAGHGGGDPGAISQDRRHNEADLAQRLRNRIAVNLRALGVLTVTDGRYEENKPLRNDGPSVEIHFNAGPPGASGIEALAKPHLKTLSQNLCKAINKILKSPLRGDAGWKADSSGQHHRLGFCDAGGIVLEVCFISNPEELNNYLKLEAQIGDALADTLAEHVKPNNATQ